MGMSVKSVWEILHSKWLCVIQAETWASSLLPCLKIKFELQVETLDTKLGTPDLDPILNYLLLYTIKHNHLHINLPQSHGLYFNYMKK